MLVEMDDRVFPGIAVAEVADDRFHVGPVQELHDLRDAQLVEVDVGAARPDPFSYTDESFHQFSEEGVCAHMGDEIVGRASCGVGDT